jgi:hypothetical protein
MYRAPGRTKGTAARTSCTSALDVSRKRHAGSASGEDWPMYRSRPRQGVPLRAGTYRPAVLRIRRAWSVRTSLGRPLPQSMTSTGEVGWRPACHHAARSRSVRPVAASARGGQGHRLRDHRRACRWRAGPGGRRAGRSASTAASARQQSWSEWASRRPGGERADAPAAARRFAARPPAHRCRLWHRGRPPGRAPWPSSRETTTGTPSWRDRSSSPHRATASRAADRPAAVRARRRRGRRGSRRIPRCPPSTRGTDRGR